MTMLSTRRIFEVPWYPLLVSIIPVVSLFVINRAELSALDLLRPALIAALMGAGFFALSIVLTGTARKGGLASLVLLLGTMLYDQVHLLALSFMRASSPEGVFVTAWVGSGLLFYAVVCAALRRSQRSFGDITIVLNVFACSVLAIAAVPAALDVLRQHQQARYPDSESTVAAAWRQSMKTDWSQIERPDIYFIILDGYARQDILQSRFEFDNGGFLGWLASAGFVVATQSHANYPSTHYSLASTLNAEYVQQLVPRDLLANAPGSSRAKYQHLMSHIADKYIRENRVRELLDSAGYQFLSNDSGYRVTRRIPDSVRDALGRDITDFERALLEFTVLYPLLETSREDSAVAVTMHESVLRDLQELTSENPGTVPTFYFYHFLSPHFPFSFNEDGSRRLRDPVYARSAWIQDRRDLPGYLDYYRQNYPGNVAGLNRHLRATLETILQKTDRKAVIIIQSDHGSSLGFVPGSITESDIPERFGMLNAIFLPEGYSKSGLTDDFSAINTFPIVFESIFGLRIPKSADKAFMVTGPLEFEDVTDRLDGQEP